MEQANERLKYARIQAGYSSAGDFASAHGFPAVTYRAHESGIRNFRVPSAKSYAAALGMPYPSGWRWLMLGQTTDFPGGVGAGSSVLPALSASAALSANEAIDAYRPDLSPPSPQSGAIVNEHFAQIPIYDVEASAGDGSEPLDSQPIDHLILSRRVLGTLTSSGVSMLAGIAVRGDSMEPTLNHGDQILLDLNHRAPTSDGVYVVKLDNALIVKRLRIDPFRRKVSVISDNDLYPPIDQLDLEQVEVVGRVIWLGRRI